MQILEFTLQLIFVVLVRKNEQGLESSFRKSENSNYCYGRHSKKYTGDSTLFKVKTWFRLLSKN